MGGRKTLPSSRYAAELTFREFYPCTHEQYRAEPYDLIDEAMTRINKRILAENRKVKTQGK